ncbi:MAG: serine/threonine-protein kinase [Gemmatimonadales bacterium]
MSRRMEKIKAALEGKYDVQQQLGKGGMAGVYLAVRASDGESVAVKVLHPEFAVSVGAERFHREITFLASLEHPGILPLITSDEIGGFLLYVMPYAKAGSLTELLRQRAYLSLDETFDITRHVADALDYAHHQNVVHRDIKPGNILFHDGHAVLCDFGVARAIVEAGGEHLSSSGLIVGTPSYMSPEQASGFSKLTGRSDIYSLACVVYEMLVGEPPFTGRSAQAIMARHVNERPPKLRVVRPDIPQNVEDAVLAGRAKEPKKRPGSAGEFFSRLNAA